MARLGMTALRAALAGVAGGIEGRVQQQAAEDEKKRLADALARQQGMDALALEDRRLAMEDREQAKQDRLQSQRAAFLKAGYVPKGMDMPGATPRTPVSTEMVGGQEYNLYSTPRQMAMQAAMEEAALRDKFKPKDELTAWQRQQVVENALDRAARGKSGGDKKDEKAENIRTAEAWFNTPIADPQQRKQVATIFNNLRAAKPTASPQDLMLDTFNAVKASTGLENTRAQIQQRENSGSSDNILGIPLLPAAGNKMSEADKAKARAERWNELKDSALSDEQLKAQIMREIP